MRWITCLLFSLIRDSDLLNLVFAQQAVSEAGIIFVACMRAISKFFTNFGHEFDSSILQIGDAFCGCAFILLHLELAPLGFFVPQGELPSAATTPFQHAVGPVQ